MPPLAAADFAARAARLSWVLFDVDGVLTDGRLTYGPAGESRKVFDVRDGLGLKLLQRAGLKVGILSGRGGPALARRARELALDALLMGVDDKSAGLDGFLDGHGVGAEEVAYAGDDLPDLPVLRRCGLSFAPSDAAPEVRERVDCVLVARGGQGAARELAERLLKARGAWDAILAGFLG